MRHYHLKRNQTFFPTAKLWTRDSKQPRVKAGVGMPHSAFLHITILQMFASLPQNLELCSVGQRDTFPENIASCVGARTNGQSYCAGAVSTARMTASPSLLRMPGLNAHCCFLVNSCHGASDQVSWAVLHLGAASGILD